MNPNVTKKNLQIYQEWCRRPNGDIPHYLTSAAESTNVQQAFEEIAEFVAAGFVVLAVLSFSSDDGMARAVDGDAHVGMDDDSHAENSRPTEKASAA